MARLKSNWSQFGERTVKVDHIKGKPKKVTGTRLGAILGENHWKTPFQAWCEITRVAEPPFEGNKYTEAGKVIEPKLIEYCKDLVSPDLITPEDKWGEDFFSKTYGDFYPDDDVFGGMWDALYCVDGEVAGVIECKTSSRPQDWKSGVPKHYALQGFLYAELLGVKDVFFPVAFLEPSDYDNPEAFECTEDNTMLFHLTVPEGFDLQLDEVRSWFYEHVKDGGVSPRYDEKADKEYLDLMHTTEIAGLTESSDIIARIEELTAEIDAIREKYDLDAKENEIKVLTDKLKSVMMESCTNKSPKVVCGAWTLTRSVRKSIDSNALKKDGLYDKYAKETESYRLTKGKVN